MVIMYTAIIKPKPIINRTADTANLTGAYTDARAKIVAKKKRMIAAATPKMTL